MAKKLIHSSKLMLHMPTLRLIGRGCRAFSSASDILDMQILDPADESSKTQTVWPDHLLGPLGPQDKRFPMPGRVGPCINTQRLSQILNAHEETPVMFDPDNVLPPLPFQRHTDIVEQFLTSVDEIDLDIIDLEASCPTSPDLMEYKAYNCPQLLRKDFKDLFPDRNIMEGDLTVVTVCLDAEDELAVWSSTVEEEPFIQAAVGFCQALENAGFWADFIDPASGKAFKGSHKDEPLGEADDRYRKLGFEVQKWGACKVISHPMWGTHLYIGSLFTSAPLDHPLITSLVESN
ncbi:unnamed protein product [Candidula unifasciata]|uniref:Uncharacterized protein n=1 Tax=Candidula unifasciata TaxID=100452 RepID=A0A8S3ZAU3_9EUPU|nr:unnamed protein product [Candidula unifasciata]